MAAIYAAGLKQDADKGILGVPEVRF